MKNKILILLIFVTSGCSSIPRLTQNDSIDTLIQKPDLNYKTNSLPKVINIFYSNERGGYKLPDEVQGFLENYYFYKGIYKKEISQIMKVSKHVVENEVQARAVAEKYLRMMGFMPNFMRIGTAEIRYKQGLFASKLNSYIMLGDQSRVSEVKNRETGEIKVEVLNYGFQSYDKDEHEEILLHEGVHTALEKMYGDEKYFLITKQVEKQIEQNQNTIGMLYFLCCIISKMRLKLFYLTKL